MPDLQISTATVENVDLSKYSSVVVTIDNATPKEYPVRVDTIENGSFRTTNLVVSDGNTPKDSTFNIRQEEGSKDIYISILGAENHTISATGKIPNVKKLDKKFIDTTDIKKYVDDNNDSINAELENIQINMIGRRGSGTDSEAFNDSSVASGNYSHAEGYNTKATGTASHSEGYTTMAEGNFSHAEGHSSEADADYAHAEGKHTTAYGDSSHTEGSETKARGGNQHVFGCCNYELPNTYDADAAKQYFGYVGGKTYNPGEYAYYNNKLYVCIIKTSDAPSVGSWREATEDDEAIEIAGNGNGINPSNARVLYRSGREWLAGSIEPVGGVILKSTTADSTKRFLVTVDDTGTLKATEITS